MHFLDLNFTKIGSIPIAQDGLEISKTKWKILLAFFFPAEDRIQCFQQILKITRDPRMVRMTDTGRYGETVLEM